MQLLFPFELSAIAIVEVVFLILCALMHIPPALYIVLSRARTRQRRVAPAQKLLAAALCVVMLGTLGGSLYGDWASAQTGMLVLPVYISPPLLYTYLIAAELYFIIVFTVNVFSLIAYGAPEAGLGYVLGIFATVRCAELIVRLVYTGIALSTSDPLTHELSVGVAIGYGVAAGFLAVGSALYFFVHSSSDLDELPVADSTLEGKPLVTSGAAL